MTNRPHRLHPGAMIVDQAGIRAILVPTLASRSARDILLRTRHETNLLVVSRQGTGSIGRPRKMPIAPGDVLLLRRVRRRRSPRSKAAWAVCHWRRGPCGFRTGGRRSPPLPSSSAPRALAGHPPQIAAPVVGDDRHAVARVCGKDGPSSFSVGSVCGFPLTPRWSRPWREAAVERDARRPAAGHHLIARGLSGEPTAAVTFRGGAVNRHS